MPNTPLAETPLLSPILPLAGPGVCCDDGWITAQVMLFRVENEASGTHPTSPATPEGSLGLDRPVTRAGKEGPSPGYQP